MNQIIDFKAKTQALDALRFERIYLDMSKFAYIYSDSILNPMGVYPKLDLCLNLKNKSLNIANMPKYGYICRALSKISKSVLAGCKFSTGVHSAQSGFFVRNISMRSHLNGEAGEGHFRVCRSPVEPVCYPFQLCHQLAVNGKAPTIQQERINHA